MNAMLHTYVLVALGALTALLKDKFHIDTTHVHGIHGLLGIALGLVWHLSVVQHKVSELKSRLDVLVPRAIGAALLCLTLGTMGGCGNLQQMSDADLASFVQSQTMNDVSAALTLAAQADPAKAAEIKSDALAVKACLDGPVTQLFTSTTNAAVGSTINEAITLLQKRIAGLKNGPLIVAGVRLAYGSISALVQMPQLPTQTLGPRTKGAALAFISGASQAIDGFAGAPK